MLTLGDSGRSQMTHALLFLPVKQGQGHLSFVPVIYILKPVWCKLLFSLLKEPFNHKNGSGNRACTAEFCFCPLGEGK